MRDLKVYRKAFDSAMEIFELTKKFPKEESRGRTLVYKFLWELGRRTKDRGHPGEMRSS